MAYNPKKVYFSNVNAIIAPTVDDDESLGYEAGSLWVDTVATEAYRCVDATGGAAVWRLDTLDGSRGSMYIDSTAETVIVTTDVPVKINATSYTAENLVEFTESVDGRLRYDGLFTRVFDVSMAISMTGGSNDVYSIYVAKNGSIIASTRQQRKLGTGSDVGAMGVVGSVSLDTNDYVEIFIENNTATDNVTAENMYVNVS